MDTIAYNIDLHVTWVFEFSQNLFYCIFMIAVKFTSILSQIQNFSASLQTVISVLKKIC